MLTKIECPKDKQRLFDMYIKQNNSVSLEPLSKLINEIEIKCPKCGGIVSIDLRSENINVIMKTLGNTGKKVKENRRRLHTEQRSQ
ncbi:MAG: hypothetical protein E6344_04555 [Clostridium sp.]|uniref:hypothetical protein n=1 Tax=Clostridium culturomicium TaxID=1499683 RepID=UPI00058DFEC6|nr:hypothetical protein [Clostridium culturomicium]MDU4889418.1 hypothetical protein [Clostridium sp.]MDU7082938.1 hypothetical protein [Clostridium sp.]